MRDWIGLLQSQKGFCLERDDFPLLAVLYNSCSLPAPVVSYVVNYFWFWFLSKTEFQIWEKSELEQITCALNAVFLKSVWYWHQHRSYSASLGGWYQVWLVDGYNHDDILAVVSDSELGSALFSGDCEARSRRVGERWGRRRLSAIALSPLVSAQLPPWRASNGHPSPISTLQVVIPVIFQRLMLSFSFSEGWRTWPLQSYDLIYSASLRLHPSISISFDPVT